MSHLEDLHLIALRDGGDVDDATRTHLEACDVCGAALQEAHARAQSIADALGTVDSPVDMDASRAALKARMAKRTMGADPIPISSHRRTGPRSGSLAPLGRAAAILLVTAGAAWAIPGSPVPGWFSSTNPTGVTADGAASTVSETPAVSGVNAPARAGVRLPLADRPIAVHLDAVAPGTRIEIVRTDDQAVTVYAASGSNFTSGTADIRASLADGPVTVESPWDGFGTLAVNGRTLLERIDGSWSISGPVEEVTDDRVVLVVEE